MDTGRHCVSRTDEPHDIVAATLPADATAEPVKPDAWRLARVARRRQHEAGLCTQKRKVADEGGAVNTRRQGACKEHGKEAVRVSRVMGAVAWRARALQGCGRASGRAHLWYQPTVDEDVDVESRIRDRGWSRDREPRPVCVWRMGPRSGLHARRRLCQRGAAAALNWAERRREQHPERPARSGHRRHAQRGQRRRATVAHDAPSIGTVCARTIRRAPRSHPEAMLTHPLAEP